MLRKSLSVPRLFSRRVYALPNVKSVPITSLRIARTVLVATFTTFSICMANNTVNAEENFINLTSDGGVSKRVITQGEGESPPRGAKVKVHYIGTLLNGNKVPPTIV
jgi:hypothetical protein